MKKINIILFFLTLSSCVIHNTLFAQSTAKNQKKEADKPNAIWNIDVVGSVEKPGADMAKRFGTSYRIGLAIKKKNEKNWIYGAKLDFLTGNKMRDDSLLNNLTVSQGGIITRNGQLYNVGTFLRGYLIGVQVGKIFPILQVNPNSGPMMLASVGFMQYKINFFDRDNSFPQLTKEYKKGYDRLTNGIYIEDFIGYQYFDKRKYINFYVGLNLVWGFTQGRRDYLFDLQRSDKGARNDLLTGLKLGWVLPIYKKNMEEVYY